MKTLATILTCLVAACALEGNGIWLDAKLVNPTTGATVELHTAK